MAILKQSTMINASYALGLPEFMGKQETDITQKDLAKLAHEKWGSLSTDATMLVNSQKKEEGDGVSTLIIIYNETGKKIKYKDHYDTSGHTGKYPAERMIQNGEADCWVHFCYRGTWTGSCATYAYDVDKDKVVYFAWNGPFVGDRSVFCLSVTEKKFKGTSWKYTIGMAEKYGVQTFDNAQNGYYIECNTGNSSSPIMKVRIGLPKNFKV